MDWLILGVGVANLILLLWVLERQRRAEDQVRKINILMRVRSGRVAMKSSTTRVPQVDSRARTTKRDTPDIPARGGRMSQAVPRKTRDARLTTDD